MLTTTPTEILGVSAQIGLTTAGAVGAGRPRITSASGQVSSRQWNAGQARIERLSIGAFCRRLLAPDGGETQRSQSRNRCGEELEMHDDRRRNQIARRDRDVSNDEEIAYRSGNTLRAKRVREKGARTIRYINERKRSNRRQSLRTDVEILQTMKKHRRRTQE